VALLRGARGCRRNRGFSRVAAGGRLPEHGGDADGGHIPHFPLDAASQQLRRFRPRRPGDSGGSVGAAAYAGTGVLPYGDAAYYGSPTNLSMSSPVVTMAATPDGKGYLLAAADGGVFTHGDAGFHGSAGGIDLYAPIVGMASLPNGSGRHLHLRQRRLPRFDGQLGHQRLDRRHGGHCRRRRLLAGRL
jgi:hypothetical protein